MTAAQILQHIQSLYPGQLVLYVPQLAVVIGRSEKALAHLIERESLPFETQLFGGRRCADIFRVAEWLASNLQNRPTASAKPAHQPKPTTKPTRAASSRQSLTGKLMQMRHDAAAAMRRAIASTADPSEQAFLEEFAEEILVAHGNNSIEVVVTWPIAGSKGEGRFARRTRHCTRFDDTAVAVLDIQSRPLCDGDITVEEAARGLYSAHFDADAGKWRPTGTPDPQFAALLDFVTSQCFPTEIAKPCVVPDAWLAQQLPAVRQEVELFLSFRPDEAEVFLEAVVEEQTVLPVGLLEHLYDFWLGTPSLMAFWMAIKNLSTPDDLTRFLLIAERALRDQDDVRRFEVLWQITDPFDEVQGWLKTQACINDFEALDGKKIRDE